MISHWWSIIILKTSNWFEWSWMIPLDVFFLKSMKKCWRYYKHYTKSSQRHNKYIIPFQWGVIHPNQTNGSEIRAIQYLGTGRWGSWSQQKNIIHTPNRPPKTQKYCKITRKYGKLNFRKWKIIGDGGGNFPQSE